MAKGNLGFGFMRLPTLSADQTDIDFEQLNKMVDLFLERGFTYFDTSFVYHDGKSEDAIRRSLVERHDRGSFTLASKLPAFAITDESAIEGTFAQQRQNCGVEYFDYFLLHMLNAGNYLGADGAGGPIQTCHMFDHMRAWKAQGKIKRLGFSFHDTAEILDRILSDHPETDFVQIVVNYLDWDSGFIQSKKCYDVIMAHGKQCVIMEPVKGGALARVPERAAKAMEALDPGASPASWALRFCGELPNVAAVLSGMSTLAQVEDNTSAMADLRPMSKEEKGALAITLDAIRAQQPFTGADFKLCDAACPKGIPVSGVLEAYNNIMYQPVPTFAAELNYYNLIAPRTCPVSECDGCGKCTAAVGGAVDVPAALREAADFMTEHSF